MFANQQMSNQCSCDLILMYLILKRIVGSGDEIAFTKISDLVAHYEHAPNRSVHALD